MCAFLVLQLEFYNSFVTNSNANSNQMTNTNSLAWCFLFLFSHRYYISTNPELDMHARHTAQHSMLHIALQSVRWVQCALKSVYKFHLILSIRYFIGSNEQFTKILPTYSNGRAQHVSTAHSLHMCILCHLHLALENTHTHTFGSDFRVTLSGYTGKRPNETLFFVPLPTFSHLLLDLNSRCFVVFVQCAAHCTRRI